LGIPNFLEGMCRSIYESCNTTPNFPPLPPPTELDDVGDLFDIMQFLAAHVNVVSGEDAEHQPGEDAVIFYFILRK